MYRPKKGLANIIICFVLIIVGVAFFIELSIALFSGRGGIGGFFLDGLSWAAFILPGYFFFGAIILSVPGFREDLLLGLILSLLPFFFLAASAKYMESPQLWNSKIPVLEVMGSIWSTFVFLALAGLSAVIVFIAAKRLGSSPSTVKGNKKLTNLSNNEEEQKLEPKFDLSLAELPPVPSLQSIATTEVNTESNVTEANSIIEELESHDEETSMPEQEPEQNSELLPELLPLEEPISLMFGRIREETTNLAEVNAEQEKSDPAMDPGYWAESDENKDLLEETAFSGTYENKPLLSKVEVFQDGEHIASVRAANQQKTIKPNVKVKPACLNYSIPTDGILMVYPDGQYWIIDEKTRKSAEVLRDTLSEFGIEAEVTGIRKGPVVTMFEILPAPGVRLSKIANLSDNIALRLAASSVRIVAPIPGKHAVGIEVPNEKRSIVSFREIVESESFANTKMEVPVVLGKDISGEVQVAELTQTPHLLIAGATGSGKSVCVNAIILSILYKRSFNEVKLLLIDPKIVELKLYNGIPHLLTPVITEPKKAFQALQYCICEMERRYSLLDAMGVRDIRAYNRKIKEKAMATESLPYIVIIIDEFADLMATTGKELESTLARLAAMSRAVGLHLVLATQRPSIDVITGLIKANIPSRIAFMVASKFDSRIIIDAVGAEKLLGRGDMLYSSATDAFPVRIQGAFVSDDEVERVVAQVKTLGSPDYIDEEIFVDDEDDEGPSLFDEEDEDPLYEKALEIVMSQGKASASFLQRRLKIGYNRAARLVELMEEKGIVGKAQGSKPRDVMYNPDFVKAPNPSAKYIPDLEPEEKLEEAEDNDEDYDD